MKISIITVTYNAASTIVDTLESVSNQTHPDVEHIVVDGASTDGTLRLVESQGRHVAKFVSEPDHGIYDAMNKGLRLATGRIIGFLNADDTYADNRVLERVANTMGDSGLDAIFGDVEFYRSGRPDSPVRRYRSKRFRPERIAWGWMPAHPTLFLRREVYERVGLFRTDYRIAGDFEFIARAFKAGTIRFRYLPEVLVRMRLGGASTGGLRSTLTLNREVLRACRENGIATNAFKLLSKYPFKILEFLRW